MKKIENKNHDSVARVYTHTHTGNLRNKKGITLLALIVTIIVLLILAGISIAGLTVNGLFEKSQLAKEKQENAQIKEDTILADYKNKIDNILSGTNRETENNKEIKFYNGNQDFQNSVGEVEFNTYGLTYKTFHSEISDGAWNIAKCEKIENIDLNSKFEISAQIYFNNETTYDMGGITLKLCNDEKEKTSIQIEDGWEGENAVMIECRVDENQIYFNKLIRYNASGRYAIIGDGNKVYFYWGTKLLGSIDYTESISYDKITIEFQKYYDNNHSVPPIYVESLYIGEPLYYKSILQ